MFLDAEAAQDLQFREPGVCIVDDDRVGPVAQDLVDDSTRLRGLEKRNGSVQLGRQPSFANARFADEQYIGVIINQPAQRGLIGLPAYQVRSGHDAVQHVQWSIEQGFEFPTDAEESLSPVRFGHQRPDEPVPGIHVWSGEPAVLTLPIKGSPLGGVEWLQARHHDQVDAQSLLRHPSQAGAQVVRRVARGRQESSALLGIVWIEREVDVRVSAEVVPAFHSGQARIARLQQRARAPLELRMVDRALLDRPQHLPDHIHDQ